MAACSGLILLLMSLLLILVFCLPLNFSAAPGCQLLPHNVNTHY